MTATTPPLTDLSACDKEPIHIPGTIQPPGGLVVLEPVNWRITHASANIETLTAIPHDKLVGQTLSAALGRDLAHRLTNALTTSLGPTLPGRAFGLDLQGGALCNAAIHSHDDRILLEFEPALASREDTLPLLLVRAMLTRMQDARTTVGVCEAAIDQLHTLIGFDRVMVYQFLHDGSGCVIAEKTRPGTASFLGHHYPASDIPAQARALYVKNWIRTIADVNAVPVPILPPQSRSERPIDLSYCSQRSVSPIHIEYLKNMGVAASMSISIVVGGALWGMIACHHGLPRQVAAETRVAAELFGQAFSLQLHAIQRLDATQLLRAARARLDKLAAELPSTGTLLESLGPRLVSLASILPCDGAGLWISGEWQSTGAVPMACDVPALAGLLAAKAKGDIFATHQLSLLLPEASRYAETACGMLAVPLSRTPGDYLIFFRREFIQSINWAGDPDKPVQEANPGERLSPRKSFEIWKKEVRGTSRVWEGSDRLAAEALRITLLEVVLRFTEVVAQEKAKTAEQQRVFVSELNHRVKNALALVGALVKQSQSSHESISMFIADLEGRILSLAKAHDQANTPGALDLRALIETELAPFQAPGTGRIVIEGAAMALDNRAFAVLALVFHEMTTNAAKHGALSVTGGGVAVRWQIDNDGACALLWSENNGPRVVTPARTGFGSKLIERQIPFELGGTVSVAYDPDGVRIFLRIPAQNIVRVPAAMATPTAPVRVSIPVVSAVAMPFAGRSFLVVEDSLLVALETEDILIKSGATRVTVCSTVEQARVHLAAERPDFAILDINLTGGTSIPVADVLLAARIPFVFATGYGAKDALPDRFAAVHILTKPYSRVPLIATIERALAAL
jgi:light-regulated signal transduction histidine kinase (bacteriophytochrome)/CheY-like chemotaxis protein